MREMFKKVNAREKLIGWYPLGQNFGLPISRSTSFSRDTPQTHYLSSSTYSPKKSVFPLMRILPLRRSRMMALPPPKPLSILPRSSKLKRLKRLESNTCYEIFETSLLELSPLASLNSCNHCRVYIYASETSAHTSRKCSMVSFPSIMLFSETYKISSISSPTSPPHLRHGPMARVKWKIVNLLEP